MIKKTILKSRYKGLNERCSCQNNKDYPNYGGRGIVCEWSSFEEFYKDMSVGFSKELTLERNDVNGNYSKENCRWATWKEQANNRTNNHIVEFNEEFHTLSEWAEILDFKRYILENRLNRGWSVEDAFTRVIQKYVN